MNVKPWETKGVVFGWWCELVHDYIEPEGHIFFTATPVVGDKVLLPSSGYKEEWTITQVMEEDMAIRVERKDA